MGEISVSANRIAKETFRTPNSISVIEKSQMERITATITPQILAETVGILAQQNTVGQGSPILRGLTGYQTLLQIDNVRLNNSTFRSGPNQYLSTIASHGLDRIEVLRGPNSMLYGSGAIGGVLGAYLINYPNARVLVLIPLGFFSQLIRIRALYVLGFWFILQFINSYFSSSTGGGVAYAAHIGGFVSGIILILILNKKKRRKVNKKRKGPWEY